MDWERKPRVSFPYYAWVGRWWGLPVNSWHCVTIISDPSDIDHGKQGSESAGALPKNVVLFFASVMLRVYLKGESGFMTCRSASLRHYPSLLSLNCTIRHLPPGSYRETFVCSFGGHPDSSWTIWGSDPFIIHSQGLLSSLRSSL